MTYINSDSTLTESGAKILRFLKSGAKMPEHLAEDTGLPLFKVRGALRELSEAGYAVLKDERYAISPKGIELLAKL